MEHRMVLEALLRCATHCQGGHSEAGMVTAEALGIPFPLTMPDLIACAQRHGFDPKELWRWYFKTKVEG